MIKRISTLTGLVLLCAAAIEAQDIKGNPDSPKLNPEETLESLKKEISSLAGKDDTESIQRRRNLEVYISTAEANECAFRSFANLKVYIENDAIVTETKRKDIQDLLNLRRRQLFSECRATLHHKLDEAIEKLSAKQNKMARAIAKSVVEANGGDSNFTDKAVAKGIADYLKHTNGLNRLGSQRIFLMSWRRHIIEACEAVDEDIYGIAFIYRSLDEETYAELDQAEKEWCLVSRVCNRIDEFARDRGVLEAWKAL